MATYIKDAELKRIFLLQRDGNRCKICNCPMVKSKVAGMPPGNAMTLDHIVPFSAGGNDEVGNLQLLCYDCNRKKGATFPDFMIEKNIKKQITPKKKTIKKKKKGWSFSIIFKFTK